MTDPKLQPRNASPWGSAFLWESIYSLLSSFTSSQDVNFVNLTITNTRSLLDFNLIFVKHQGNKIRLILIIEVQPR